MRDPFRLNRSRLVCETCDKHFHQTWALESHQRRSCGFGTLAIGDGYLLEHQTQRVLLIRTDNGRLIVLSDESAKSEEGGREH